MRAQLSPCISNPLTTPQETKNWSTPPPHRLLKNPINPKPIPATRRNAPFAKSTSILCKGKIRVHVNYLLLWTSPPTWLWYARHLCAASVSKTPHQKVSLDTVTSHIPFLRNLCAGKRERTCTQLIAFSFHNSWLIWLIRLAHMQV